MPESPDSSPRGCASRLIPPRLHTVHHQTVSVARRSLVDQWSVGGSTGSVDGCGIVARTRQNDRVHGHLNSAKVYHSAGKMQMLTHVVTPWERDPAPSGPPQGHESTLECCDNKSRQSAVAPPQSSAKTVTTRHERSLLTILPGQSVRSHCHPRMWVVSSFQAVTPNGSGWTGDSSSLMVSGRSLHRRTARRTSLQLDRRKNAHMQPHTAERTWPLAILYQYLYMIAAAFRARMDRDARPGWKQVGRAGARRRTISSRS